jgi:hypothetical protein
MEVQVDQFGSRKTGRLVNSSVLLNPRLVQLPVLGDVRSFIAVLETLFEGVIPLPVGGTFGGGVVIAKRFGERTGLSAQLESILFMNFPQSADIPFRCPSGRLSLLLGGLDLLLVHRGAFRDEGGDGEAV